jgi:hypothetical protein
MQKDLEADIIRHLRSWHPVVREYWWIKFSNYKGNILIFVGSTLTGQVLTRYFPDEDLACKFINWVLNQDPTKLLKCESQAL